MFRRETIIALRARHQAYRIASEIVNPHVQTPRPPQPAMPVDPPNLTAFRREGRRAAMILAAIVWGLVVVYWLIAWITKKG